MPARRCWVALALLLLGSCATLTADQQAGLDEAKAFLAAAAKAYGVWTPGLVVGSTTNEGGYYRGGTIFMRDSMLTWKYRDATLAHEFSHISWATSRGRSRIATRGSGSRKFVSATRTSSPSRC
jgi:hypothetical protein